jgi:hypothetical protein
MHVKLERKFRDNQISAKFRKSTKFRSAKFHVPSLCPGTQHSGSKRPGTQSSLTQYQGRYVSCEKIKIKEHTREDRSWDWPRPGVRTNHASSEVSLFLFKTF